MDAVTARDRVLDAAEELFYAHGVHAVGIDDIRDASGVSLKLLYQLFSGKEELVEAVLERRDVRWRGRLAAYVAGVEQPEMRILAVFDWLHQWFSETAFRGCAWINLNGELGATSPAVCRQARAHKLAFIEYLRELVLAAQLPDSMTGQLALLAEGAMVTAGIFARADPALEAREAAARLIQAARTDPSFDAVATASAG
ncbi:MAG TPA: TetR/AcrR family transcriptional regulator [Solirubrobacteraceae bacterium]|nr:TetR/AcrR family transcriptional regulator [Solirubrobacteraceae bacterium]